MGVELHSSCQKYYIFFISSTSFPPLSSLILVSIQPLRRWFNVLNGPNAGSLLAPTVHCFCAFSQGTPLA